MYFLKKKKNLMVAFIILSLFFSSIIFSEEI